MPGKTSKIKFDAAFAERDSAGSRSSLLPGGWWLWCLLGLALGLGVWFGGRRYLRIELTSHLTSVESSQKALESIEALLRLDGDAAIDVSRALGHSDFVVAHAAFQALNEQLDAWSQLEPAERMRRMELLTGELERIPRESDQDHRILVTGLASRLYAEALSSRDEVAGQLLDRCKRIIDRKAPSDFESTSASAAALAEEDGVAPIESADSQATATLSDTSLAHSPMPRLSSSADELSSPSQPARVHLTGAPSRQATLVDREAPIRLSDVGSQAFPLPRTDAEQTHDQKLRAARPFDASGANNQTSSGNGPADDPSYSAVDGETTEDSKEEGRAEQSLAGIDNLSIDQLVRLLSSVQPRVAQAAALALRRKGMSDDKLDLAMQLAVGSSSQRMTILQALGQRSDLDPRPWLLWMAADGDQAVREQAVGMLAPLLDQDVRRQLRLLLNQERDERVAQTLRRVLMR